MLFLPFVSALLAFQSLFFSTSTTETSSVVSLTAMNVLYVGVENPVKIAVPGYRADQVTASGCGISKSDGENYIAKPLSVGIDTIVVTAGSKNYSNSIRVRRIPDPYVYLVDVRGGSIGISKFKSATGITVKAPDFVFQLNYQILSFEMVYAPKVGNVVTDVSNSANFSKLMRDIQVKSKPGDIIVIQNVRVQMPDERIVPISTSFKLIG